MPPPLLFLIRSLPPPRTVGNITRREHGIDSEKREDVRIEVKSKGRKRNKKKGSLSDRARKQTQEGNFDAS